MTLLQEFRPRIQVVSIDAVVICYVYLRACREGGREDRGSKGQGTEAATILVTLRVCV